ncbi:MAG: hypothetical protein HQL26_07110 [Candidatus Omnitrophica bacterium]|nr:hypothetical protein [Candidatus Omnitrophota bacterium]
MKSFRRHQELGQNLIEYTMVFILAVLVLIVFLRPKGLFVNQVNKSLDQAVSFIGQELKKK